MRTIVIICRFIHNKYRSHAIFQLKSIVIFKLQKMIKFSQINGIHNFYQNMFILDHDDVLL